ncbi:D-lactate dehydrogenase [Pseudomonas duriflava]|uniref:D-lactate dehydrogenase n=1 Tax=Pseudomonas duriflava TaxID=459528 RepID=A0A562QHN3_9PSED|nr:D-lactate dehydrogenase [Pseudomonas duriflava]
MRTLLFSSQIYDRNSFEATNRSRGLRMTYQPAQLSLDTVSLVEGFDVVCAFVNDVLSSKVLTRLASGAPGLSRYARPVITMPICWPLKPLD